MPCFCKEYNLHETQQLIENIQKKRLTGINWMKLLRSFLPDFSRSNAATKSAISDTSSISKKNREMHKLK